MNDTIILLVIFPIIATIVIIFVVYPIIEFKKLREIIEAMPEGLWDIVKKTYRKYDLLIEVRGDTDYAKNKIINANTKIKYFKSIQDYCEERIKDALKEVGED